MLIGNKADLAAERAVRKEDGVQVAKVSNAASWNSYSYRFPLFNKKQLLSEESCSVIGLSEKMGFQL